MLNSFSAASNFWISLPELSDHQNGDWQSISDLCSAKASCKVFDAFHFLIKQIVIYRIMDLSGIQIMNCGSLVEWSVIQEMTWTTYKESAIHV